MNMQEELLLVRHNWYLLYIGYINNWNLHSDRDGALVTLRCPQRCFKILVRDLLLGISPSRHLLKFHPLPLKYHLERKKPNTADYQKMQTQTRKESYKEYTVNEMNTVIKSIANEYSYWIKIELIYLKLLSFVHFVFLSIFVDSIS